MTSRNRLDMITVDPTAADWETSAADGAAEEEPLGSTAVTLLACLGAAWGLIGLYCLADWLKNRKKKL